MKIAFQQILYLFDEVKKMNHACIWQWGCCWFSPGFLMIFSYRVNRFFYLLFGKCWSVARVYSFSNILDSASMVWEL